MVSPVKEWYSLQELWAAYGMDPESVKTAAQEGLLRLWLHVSDAPFFVLQQPPRNIQHYFSERSDDFIRLAGVVGVTGFVLLNADQLYWGEVDDVDLSQALKSKLELVWLDSDALANCFECARQIDVDWAKSECLALDPEWARDHALRYLPLCGLTLPAAACLHLHSSDLEKAVSLYANGEIANMERVPEPCDPLPPTVPPGSRLKGKTPNRNPLRADVLRLVVGEIKMETGLSTDNEVQRAGYTRNKLMDLCRQKCRSPEFADKKFLFSVQNDTLKSSFWHTSERKSVYDPDASD